MDSARWQQIQSIFHQAADRPTAEREAFLRSACGEDRELLVETMTMLHEDQRATSLLERGLPDIACQIVGTAAQSISAQVIGPDRLKKILGEGGMGVVWLAEREDTGQAVAIKFLPHAGLSPARRERFTHEIKTLAKLHHPYIARLYDAGTLTDGTPWFVMELVEGVHFTEYCRLRCVTVEDRLRLFKKVCEAALYAHGQEIIHRDLKPSNILVEQDGTPRLLDFGIARELQKADEPAERTRPELRFMSPDYAAPEWVRDGTVGLSTDVYSLGVLFYEMLAGRLPAKDLDGQEGIEKPSVAGRPLLPLSKSAWSDLDVLCLKAMHTDQQQRYRSVEALLRDVDHYLKGEPLESGPDSMLYRLGKFARRNQRAVVTTMVSFALVAGLILITSARVARARTAFLAEAARTQRIQRLMFSLLGSEDKGAGPSSGLRVVTLLDRWSKQAGSLESDPQTQAELYETLGTLYDQLGEFSKADDLLRAALNKMKATLPRDDPKISDALAMLAILRGDQAKYKEAVRLAGQAVALSSRQLSSEDPIALRARIALGRVLMQSGDYEKSIATLQPLVERQPTGEEGAYLLRESLSPLSVAQYYSGRFGKAQELDRRVLAVDSKLFGTVHPEVAIDLLNLGSTELSQSQLGQAEQHYRQAVNIATAWYGADHPDVASCLAILAWALMVEGKHAEAKTLLEKALPIQERAYGGVHDRVAFTLTALGKIAASSGDLATAEADFTRAFKINQTLFGVNHVRAALVSLELANVYQQKGQYARAERMIRDALKIFQAGLPPEDPHTALAEASLGRSLLRQKRYSEAEAPLLLGYQLLRKTPHPALDQLRSTRQDLADLYGAMHQPQRAGELLGELTAAKR